MIIRAEINERKQWIKLISSPFIIIHHTFKRLHAIGKD